MIWKDQIENYFAQREEELVGTISRLVKIPSIREEAKPGKPFGEGPARALEEALAICREWGFSTENIDGYVGVADLNEAETALHILGHLDVVGPGTGWTVTEPFEPKMVDGMLYGRGTSDDKGPVIAALLAMRAVRDLKIPLKHNARIIMGVDEESGSSDIAYYYTKHPYAPYSFSPDADFPLINIEKGHYRPNFGGSWPASEALPRVQSIRGGVRANVVPPEARANLLGLARAQIEPVCTRLAAETGTEFLLREAGAGVEIICKGTGAHAAMPQEGNNALTALLALLANLPLASCGSSDAIRALHTLFPHGDTAGQGLGVAQSDPISGELTVNLALAELDETGFTAKIDSRFPLCANEENCAQVVQAAFARYGISITGDGQMTPPHHTPADSTLVKTLLGCYEAYTGEKGYCIAIGGGTYVHDIPGGVAFGCTMPGFEPNLHGADEHAKIADLLMSCKIFAQAIVELCGEEKDHTTE